MQVFDAGHGWMVQTHAGGGVAWHVHSNRWLRADAASEAEAGRAIALLAAQLGFALQPASRAPASLLTMLRGAGYGTLFVELTAQCNEACTHCYAEASPVREEALSNEALSALLADAKTLGFEMVQLTGGDPLIAPGFLHALRTAHALKIPAIEIFTNGLALTREVAAEIAAAEARMAFSVYSHDAAVHDAITRTPRSHERTMRAIALCQELGIRFRAALIEMADNAGGLAATRAYLQDVLGVRPDQMSESSTVQVGRGLVHLGGRRKGAAAAVAAPLPAPGAIGHDGRADTAFSGRLAIGPQGDIWPCIFDRNRRLGSIFPHGLRAALAALDTPFRGDLGALASALAQHESRLSCWQCRLRATMLDAHGPARATVS